MRIPSSGRVLAALGVVLIAVLGYLSPLGSHATSSEQSPMVEHLVSQSFVDPNHGWAAAAVCPATSSGGSSAACRTTVYQTTDGAKTWQSIGNVLVTPRKIQFVDAKTGWLIGSVGASCGNDVCPNVIMLSTNAGAKWDRVSTVSGELVDQAGVSLDDYWALGQTCPANSPCSAVLVVTTTAGNLWDNRTLDLTGHDFELQRLNQTVSWIGGTAGTSAGSTTLLQSMNEGKTWSTLSTPCRGPGALFNFATESTGWLLCQSSGPTDGTIGTLYRSTDGGHAWESLSAPRASATSTRSTPTAPANSIASAILFTTTQNGWITLGSGSVLATQDGGQTWHAVLNADEPLTAIQFVDANHGVVLGDRSVWVTSDAGATWRKATILT